MDRRLCLFGGGEHAAVVAEAATLAGWTVVGSFAPMTDGLASLGSDDDFFADPSRWRGHAFHLAFLGAPGAGARRALLKRCAPLGLTWATILHPQAVLSPSARLGVGAFIGPLSVVHTAAEIGGHAVINSAAVVEHHCRIGEGTHLAPGAVLGGGVSIGAWAFVGLGARVRDHVCVGDGAVVGMGAVAVADVAPDVMVVGSPARPIVRCHEARP